MSAPNNLSGSLKETLMHRALELARGGLYTASPNPRVGCVITDDAGNIAGEGFHREKGGAHAEISALRAAGEKARGATVFVTLEPCSHFGATPPCAQALIQAGVARVIAAMRDPNPLVAGRGLAMLQAAGIAVECGLAEHAARALNPGFLSRFERGRPFVRIKSAMSADGKTALKNGQSQWITGEAARLDVQHWRAQSCAILSGVGTVLADNPRLTVRLAENFKPPVRIILDSSLKTPADARIITDCAAPTWLVCREDAADTHKYPAHIRILPAKSTGGGRIDLPALMAQLAAQGINEIFSEAGATLNGALLAAGLADEILLYYAPKILGADARDAFMLPETTALADTAGWHCADVRPLGGDWRILLRPDAA